MVQWLRLHASNPRGVGSIPGRGTKIPHAAWRGQENVKKKRKNKKKPKKTEDITDEAL